MPEYFKNFGRGINRKEKKFYFCTVGRSGWQSVLINIERNGFQRTLDFFETIHPSREQIVEWYSKLGVKEENFPESFAIVRHPISRIESHVKWMIHKKKSKKKKEGYFDLIKFSIENLYSDSLGRNLIPAVDSILLDSTVIQYEIGPRKIADFFIENKIVEKWYRNISSNDEDIGVRVHWENCPDSLRDKILKTYEQDFEYFDYDPDDYFKA